MPLLSSRLVTLLNLYFHQSPLLSDSENCEHLKNFRNVDCVMANHSKVHDMQANLKTTN